MSATPSRGQVQIEDMSAYGSGWSGNRQLKWSAPGDGAMLMVALGVIGLGPERGFAIRILGRDPRATGP